MNKLYRPVFSLSRLFCHRVLNQQILQNARQRPFPERILLDMRQIENIWRRCKDGTLLNQCLYNCYEQNSEISTYAVDIIHFASNRNSVSFPMLYDIIKILGNYIEEKNLTVSLSLEQKMDVLSSVFKCKKYQIVQLVCTVFKFHDQPLDFMPYIKKLIQEQKFCEVS